MSLVRSLGFSLLALCVLAMPGALIVSYAGINWLPHLDWPAKLSAGAMSAAPFPIAYGAFQGWQAAHKNSKPRLFYGGLAVLLLILLCVVAWAWGGRMLI